MIRITLVRKHQHQPEQTIIKKFEDDHKAQKWLIEDSYFGEPYTKIMLWERIE